MTSHVEREALSDATGKPHSAQFAIHHEMSTTSDLQEFVKGQLQALVNQASKRFGEKVLFFGTTLYLNKEF